MTTTHVNVSFIGLGLAGLALGVRLVASPLVRVVIPSRTETGARIALPLHDAHPESLAAALVSDDPFRLTRRPSPTVYDPVQLAQPATPPPPRPTLALVGIVWDRSNDPTALVEGLPGADGPRPVRVGDTVGGLRVNAIKADRVVIVGLDTVWTLTVIEPWR